MKKRTTYTDGWHTAKAGKLEFFVEGGAILRGVMDGRTVYPYRPAKDGGLDLVGALPAVYGAHSRVSWH